MRSVLFMKSLKKSIRIVSLLKLHRHQREIDVENLAVLVHTLEKMLYILGIEFDKITMSEEDKEMYQNWRSAVKEKDFETADTLRAVLIEKGIL